MPDRTAAAASWNRYGDRYTERHLSDFGHSWEQAITDDRSVVVELGDVSPAQRKQPIKTALLDVLYVGAACVKSSPGAQAIADTNKGNDTPMVRFHSEPCPLVLKRVGSLHNPRG